MPPIHTIKRTLVATLNPEEVSKFSRIGREWWNSASSEGTGPLHYMNMARVNFIRRERSREINTLSLNSHVQLNGQKVLDVGCGGGILSESLSRLGLAVKAIDPSLENIFVAREHSLTDPSTQNISYESATIEEISQRGESFDMICALEVVEHVENPQEFLQHCGRCLPSGGSLFVSTLNRTMKSWLLAIVAAEKIAGIVPRGTHEWSKFITPQDLRKYLTNAGFETRTVTGMVPTFSPWDSGLLQSWTLADKDLDVNYIVHAVKQ